MRFHRPLGAPPLIYGHRGASARAPENTMAAFRLALDEGADGVELDVRASSDEVVVVAHDPALDRVAKRPGSVALLSAAELARIDVGSGEGIPALDDVLDAMLARGALVNVEIKGDVPDRRGLVRAVARLLARRSAKEREHLLVSSFRPELLTLLRALRARVPVAFLFDATHTGVWRAAILRRLSRPDAQHPHRTLATGEAIARWHARGQVVNAWTVDDPAEARVLSDRGVDGLITNDVAGIRKGLGLA